MPPPLPPRNRPAETTRRGFLAMAGGGLVAVTASGCASSTTRSADPEPADPAAPSLSPDVAVATLALAELRAAREAVAATSQGFPGLAAALAPVGAMHQSHEAALVDAVPEGAEPPTAPAAYTVPARRPVALSSLRQREAQLQARLVELALQASSGAFASLLGSMSAGTAQRVATWPS